MTLRRDLIVYFQQEFMAADPPILSSAEIGNYPVGRDNDFSLGLVVPTGVPEVVYGGHILYYEHAVIIYFTIPANPAFMEGEPVSPTEKQDMAQTELMNILMKLVMTSGKLNIPFGDPDERTPILSV